MEHCGDDFLASLAETMQDSEDWDDLQALETEACGTLADMFDKDSSRHNETDDDDIMEPFVHVSKNPSSKLQKHENLLHLDSTSEDEDPDFNISSKKDIKSTHSSSYNKSTQMPIPPQSTSNKKVKESWFYRHV